MIGNDPLDLGGQVALVTGAGQGAGRGIALALARHNGAVAVNDYVEERAQSVAEEIKAMGVPAVAVQADVGDQEAVRTAFAKAEEALGPVTLLVNNAGNAGPLAGLEQTVDPVFWETDSKDWDRFFRTNLFGVMNCCHTAVPGMIKAGKGRIITIISDAGRVGGSRLTVYGTAKAGAAGFMRSLAREVGRYGITANSISLGTLRIPMKGAANEDYFESDRAKAQLSQYIIRRFGGAEDVANLALFLCSDAASWITGQTYPLNGGYSLAL